MSDLWAFQKPLRALIHHGLETIRQHCMGFKTNGRWMHPHRNSTWSKQMFDPHGSSTESGNTPWIHHEYTMNTCYTHLRGRFPASFIPGGSPTAVPPGSWMPRSNVAWGAFNGGFGRLCTRLWRRGRRFQHRFVDFGHWDWLEAALPILLVGWSLWPNQKGSNLPNERLNQSKIPNLARLEGWTSQN